MIFFCYHDLLRVWVSLDGIHNDVTYVKIVPHFRAGYMGVKSLVANDVDPSIDLDVFRDNFTVEFVCSANRKSMYAKIMDDVLTEKEKHFQLWSIMDPYGWRKSEMVKLPA